MRLIVYILLLGLIILTGAQFFKDYGNAETQHNFNQACLIWTLPLWNKTCYACPENNEKLAASIPMLLSAFSHFSSSLVRKTSSG